MSGVIVTDPPKADARDVEALAGFGVATVSEAMGRTGLLGPGDPARPARGTRRGHRRHRARLAR